MSKDEEKNHAPRPRPSPSNDVILERGSKDYKAKKRSMLPGLLHSNGDILERGSKDDKTKNLAPSFIFLLVMTTFQRK